MRQAEHPADTPPGLDRAPLLARLGPEAKAALAAAAETVTLPVGAALFDPAPGADALYVVLRGEIHATEPTATGDATVRILRAGELLDEMLLLAGSRNPVRLHAARESLVARVPGRDADALVARFPELRAARERMHRRGLLCRLHPLFGTFDRALLDDVEAAADWIHLPRGTLLFEQHSRAGELFFVISGRVQTLFYGRDGSVQLRGEAGRGESVGESGFFGAEQREERVQAVRDTVVVGFTADEFDRLGARQPQLLRRVARTLVERLRRPPAAAASGTLTNVAVLPATPGAPVDDFCRRLAAVLAAFGPVLRLTADEVDARMAEPGIARTWGGSAESARLLAWLEAQEAAHRFVVYEAEEGAGAWTRRCMRQADRILLVADAAGDPAPGEVERTLFDLEESVSGAITTLVLLHPSGDCLPTGTRRWLAGRRVEAHLHLRTDRGGDFARLARVLAGRAVGLVLGGGGARGLAHIGILRALDEAGVPVDLIGGTSMGASVAAQYALGWSPERIRELNHRMWVVIRPHRRFTLPLLSVIAHHEAERCGREMYGETEIEDLWLPFYCVSSNLSTAAMVVHRRGSLLRSLTASASLPGAALPVLENGELLVDGALINNVPVDVMRDLGCGVIIASEVSVEDDASFTCERIPSPWELLWNRIRRRERVRFPSLLDVVMRASMLQSVHRQREALALADFVFCPHIDHFPMMDFTRLDEIVRTGYEHARDTLPAWIATGRLPAVDGAAS